MSYGSYGALERVASRDRENAEAQARPARVRFFARTRGVGETRLEGKRGITFGAIMLEEPSFSFGVINEGNMAAQAAPLATATVLRWKRQGQFWVGADLVFVVDGRRPDIRLKFSMTFEGITLRTTNPLRGAVR